MTDVVASAESAELFGWSPRRTGHALAGGAPLVLYVRFSAEGATVCDLGATLTALQPLSPEQRAAARDICHRNDVQIEGGALLAHVAPAGEVGEAVERLGRVCSEVSRTASEGASPRG